MLKIRELKIDHWRDAVFLARTELCWMRLARAASEALGANVGVEYSRPGTRRQLVGGTVEV